MGFITIRVFQLYYIILQTQRSTTLMIVTCSNKRTKSTATTQNQDTIKFHKISTQNAVRPKYKIMLQFFLFGKRIP